MKDRKQRKLDHQALWEYALRALGGRAHSAGELREKLMRRAEKQDDVAGVLRQLKDNGYLDDKRYAASFSASRLENDGLGRARVLNDLRRRRVAPAVAENAVSETYRETDEVELIEAYLRRKFRGVTLNEYLAEPRHLAAAYRRLRTAGFSTGNSIRVLKRFAAEPEVLDGLESGEEPGEE